MSVRGCHVELSGPADSCCSGTNTLKDHPAGAGQTPTWGGGVAPGSQNAAGKAVSVTATWQRYVLFVRPVTTLQTGQPWLGNRPDTSPIGTVRELISKTAPTRRFSRWTSTSRSRRRRAAPGEHRPGQTSVSTTACESPRRAGAARRGASAAVAARSRNVEVGGEMEVYWGSRRPADGCRTTRGVVRRRGPSRSLPVSCHYAHLAPPTARFASLSAALTEVSAYVA